MRALLLALAGCAGAPADDTGAPADDTAGDTDAAAPITLRNAPETCSRELHVGPSPGEEGSVLAARFAPSDAPFSATRFTYVVSNETAWETTCVGTGEHTVVAYVSGTGSPPADGVAVATVTFPADATTAPTRVLEADFPSPIRLELGQELFLGLVTSGTAPDVSCARVCLDDPYTEGMDWWSQTTAAPYDWVALGSLGMTAHIQASVSGETVD